jgi:hypothetical protein
MAGISDHASGARVCRLFRATGPVERCPVPCNNRDTLRHDQSVQALGLATGSARAWQGARGSKRDASKGCAVARIVTTAAWSRGAALDGTLLTHRASGALCDSTFGLRPKR